MNVAKFTLPALLMTVTLLAPLRASASNYPPDYDVCGPDEYAYAGPFELILDTVDMKDHAQLTVAYDGYLRDLYADEDINIYISLNGHDAFIGASAGVNDDAYIFLDSGPRNCVWCATNYSGNPSACDGFEPQYDSSGGWVCQAPSSLEEHMFFWAFDAWGDRNAWDIYVAAEANGAWDSNWGNNYYARFEADHSCY
ncbi:hypothetical protein [Enhygromyxa salina]|uniref:Uncharacterized protein n=1 Tax=Enhygromyxa salina TaxID=215803 RepID=A0A2S9XKX7_9BACT|nr:hypothetical protein [Enhygromyxa salina]PRP93534.1 hypothetical protein ENSA7_79620 [Enhygromyxa salina]